MFRVPPVKNYRYIIAVVALVSSSSCQKKEYDQAWWRAENERIGLEQQLELRNFQMKARMPVATDEDLLAVKSRGLGERLSVLKERKAELSLAVNRAASELEDYKIAMVRERRQSVTGREWKEFRTAKGRIYRDVTIASVDDVGVSIRHQNGSARLGFDDLDQAQRDMFALDGELAMKALREELAREAAYQEWMDREMQVAADQEKRQESSAADKAVSTRLLASNVVTRRPSLLAEPPRRFRNGSWRDHSSVNYSPRRYRNRPTYYHVYYIRRPRNVSTLYPHPSQSFSTPGTSTYPTSTCP